jgi:hypothetical protein
VRPPVDRERSLGRLEGASEGVVPNDVAQTARPAGCATAWKETHRPAQSLGQSGCRRCFFGWDPVQLPAEADQRAGGPADVPDPLQQPAPAAQRPGSPAGSNSASPAPPPDRGPADLSPRQPVRKSWRTLASSPGHRLATLPLWLGATTSVGQTADPRVWAEGASRGRRVRVERDCSSPSPAHGQSGRRLR